VALILDEPTTGVDAVSRQEFWQMLQELKSRGITILVSTPYMDEAGLCDRIALMQNGRVLQTDTPAGIIQRYSGSLYEIKSADMHRLATLLHTYPDTASCLTFGEFLHLRLHNDDDAVGARHTLPLLQYLAQHGVPDVVCNKIPPTVEDCFIQTEERGAGNGERGTGENRSPFSLLRSPFSVPPSPFSITARNLTKKFGDFTAVNAISFEVEKGEIFGFLGANGAGKTTAMRMLTGLLKPTSGEACVGGFDVYRQSERIKQHIGYMSQRFSLYEDLTVAENIAFYGGIYGLPAAAIRQRSEELYERIGLGHARHTLIRAIPLGWRQKLAFMVSILHRPEIVFLDEPTGGVDPITRRRFWELIYEAADSGITVFVTTHYMDEAEYCRRISVMSGGVIAAMGSPAELKQQYGAKSINEVFIKIAR
jgi:ABC-2 type transport system ATP-binding protein